MDHDLLQVGSPESVAYGESFRPDLFEAFVVILDALVEGAPMRLSGTVNRTGFGHRFLHSKTDDEGGSRSQGGLKGQEACQGVADGARKSGRTAYQTCPGTKGNRLSADRRRRGSENENVTGRSHPGAYDRDQLGH